MGAGDSKGLQRVAYLFILLLSDITTKIPLFSVPWYQLHSKVK